LIACTSVASAILTLATPATHHARTIHPGRRRSAGHTATPGGFGDAAAMSRCALTNKTFFDSITRHAGTSRASACLRCRLRSASIRACYAERRRLKTDTNFEGILFIQLRPRRKL
jgi:hypothetical protein